MTETTIAQYITESFPEVETADNYGYKFFFYGADRMRPFASLATADYDYDRFSNLDRPGIFRLNIGIRKTTFEKLFGTGSVNFSDYDFTSFDRIMPHPEYSAQCFICVLNPAGATLETVRELLSEAHELAMTRHAKREKPNDRNA